MRTHLVHRLVPALWLALVLPPAVTCVARAGEPATGPIDGMVLDRQQRPLKFASVAMRDEKRGALSDEHGWFHLAHLRPGGHRLRIYSLGFATWSDSVLVRAGAVDTVYAVMREIAIHDADTTFRLLPTTPRSRDHDVRLLATPPRR